MEFIDLINKTIEIINNEILSSDEMFVDRYKKMNDYLERLKVGYERETICKKNICLSIVRMIDHGDSETLKDMVTKLNHYYQENIYVE